MRIVRLKANQGHQGAIALDLAYVDAHLRPERLIVMDFDGEDEREAIDLLLSEAVAHPDVIIVAQLANVQKASCSASGSLRGCRDSN